MEDQDQEMLQNFKDLFVQHFGDDITVQWFITEPTEPIPVIGEFSHNGHTFQIVGVWEDQVEVQLIPPRDKYIAAYSDCDGYTSFRVTNHQLFNREQLFWCCENLIEKTSLISVQGENNG